MISKRLGTSIGASVLSMIILIGSGLFLGCDEDSNPASSGTGDNGTDPAEYNIERTLSDEAQRNTISFDGLAFMTGNLGAQSFLPPGKVADYSGFQYLRDNDATEMGHNTDFVTIIAFNMLNIMSTDQLDQMVTRAENQVDLINQYAYARFPLLKAFRRLLEGDIPDGANGLSKDAVMAASAEIYRIDGEISYDRADLMGSIIRSMTTDQIATLDNLGDMGGVGNWDRTLSDPLQSRNLPHDVHVAVMTYASEMYSWYAGSVVGDTYFCPERQGTYFGSFYLKDWPAMGNPDYTIDEQLTAQAGENFLSKLTSSQYDIIADLVNIQNDDLNDIVTTRAAISTELRRFLTDESIDQSAVMSMSETYGEFDGAILYEYASAFAEVFASLSTSQIAELESLVDDIGYYHPEGAFLYSAPAPMPTIENTDYLFDYSGTPSFTLGSSEVEQGGTLPMDYSCDGSGATLPLEWSGFPDEAQSFALIMHHEADPTDIHWYWIIYDIPTDVSTLVRNVTGVGTLGTNGVNNRLEYAPPCSQGPGAKTYVYTLYALSEAVDLTVDPEMVDRVELLEAMSDITLATAELEVIYSRP